MSVDRDITALLERAVADVVPAQRRPTDAVLARAAGRRFGRLRRALAGLVGVALVGGGAVVVATGSDDDRRSVKPPEQVRLEVTPLEGWSVVDEPLAVGCATALAPRTVYRNAAFGDLGGCGATGPTVSGPTLLVGHLEPQVAERIRATGSPVTAAGLPGFASGFDTVSAYVVWVPAGVGDLAYAVAAPHGPDDAPAFLDLSGAGTWPVSREALDAAARVTARGPVPRRPVLPDEVAAVTLRQGADPAAPAAGATVLGAAGVARVTAALRPSTGGSCAEPTASRTLHVQDGRTGRWSRVEVTQDAAGCRTALSELGGSARVSGDPVAAALASGSPQTAVVTADAEVVTAHGLSVAVPQGWAVVRAPAVDPCRLLQPSVVVADVLEPSCLVGAGARPVRPYLWLTARPLEDDRFRTASGLRLPPSSREVVTVDGLRVTWTGEDLAVGGSSVEGLLGRPAAGQGRVFVAGLGSAATSDLQRSVRPG